MVSRSILALFAVALIAASVNAAPAEIVEVDVDNFDFDDDEERGIFSDAAKALGKKVAKQVLEFFNKEIKKVNFDCATEVVKSCKINPVAHPKNYYNCAKNYVLEHKSHCYQDAEPAEEVEVDVDNFDFDDDEERGIFSDAAKGLGKKALEYFKTEAKKVNWDCVAEVVKSCKINPLAHPIKYLKCAKNYVQEHKSHCYQDA